MRGPCRVFLTSLAVKLNACSDRPVSIVAPEVSVAPLDSSRLAELRKFEEGGCAVWAPDSKGTVRGMAIPRKMLPFHVNPVGRTENGNTNGRAVRMKGKKPDGTVVTLSCWLPNTVTHSDLAESVQQSKKYYVTAN